MSNLGTQAYFEVRWPNDDGGSSSSRHDFKAEEARQATLDRRTEGKNAILVLVNVIEIPV